MACGNRRGPNGAGPRTGHGDGFCTGHDRPGYTNHTGGRCGNGFARGGGRGRDFAYERGYGPNFERYPSSYTYAPAPISKEDEKKFLQNEVELLEKELDATKKRLNEIENDKE